jgi:biotin synthase-related radical SAM superfamily protein|tara:strand:- start:546 stop:731 length:186 start_codon:yes stop_codon:yes gene_type:complete
MIFKFICRFHYPVRAEIYLSADDEKTAREEFKKLNHQTFDWTEDAVRQEFSTLEVFNGQKS